MSAPSEALPPFLAARLGRTGDLAFRPPYPRWQAGVRAAWRAALPPEGRATATPLGGALHRFHYATGAEGEGALLLPPGPGPHPGVILLHDHGGAFAIGWQKLVDGPAGAAHAARHYGGRALAGWLRAQGHAVLVADALGWGSRHAGGHDQQQALAAQAMQLGWSLAGIVAAEDRQAFRWLAAHPRVDPGRIAAFGFSFGGFRAWQLAALEPGVRATVALSWMGRRAALLAPGGTLLRGQSAFYTLHPALAGRIDFPDMAGLAADRPLFLRMGDRDGHFPPAACGPAFADLRRIAEAAGGACDAAFFEGGHDCPRAVQDQAADFLARHL